MSTGVDSREPDIEPKFAAIRREAETQGFCARLDRPVDFINWSRESFWSAEEATALLVGLEPDDVNWDVLEQAVTHSTVANEISRLRKILKRAQGKGDLQTNGYPHEFAAWANLRRIEIPAALLEAISEYGRPIPDWDQRVALQDIADRQRTPTRDVKADWRPENDDRELTRSERRSAQTIIIAMAVKKYAYKPSERGSVPAQIVGHADELGLTIDDNTVRSWLTKSARLLPPSTLSAQN